jgi:hypothetical protein
LSREFYLPIELLTIALIPVLSLEKPNNGMGDQLAPEYTIKPPFCPQKSPPKKINPLIISGFIVVKEVDTESHRYSTTTWTPDCSILEF